METPSSFDSPTSPNSSPKLSREEEAKQVLEHTTISPLVSWGLIGSFLLTIFLVPTVQLLARTRSHEPIFPPLNPSAGFVPQADELKQFEGDLETQSVVAGWVLPRTQSVLTRLGVGNEKACVGRDGWLCFRGDLDYVSGRGFLEPSHLNAGEEAADENENSPVATDPVAAIVRFKEQLAKRGITLVLLPCPLKPMIEPQQFSARPTSFSAPLQNPSYADFVRQMQQNHVLVYDPTPALFEARQKSGQAQFLRTDTHWTPSAMQTTSAGLAAFLGEHAVLPPLPPATTHYKRRSVQLSGQGDIARMLHLPPNQTAYPLQSVQLEQVGDGKGVWRSSPASDVLLLGDSFTNIYSRGAMGWGSGAGLAEQLSFDLGRPLDVIAINAGGSYSTRRRLRDELLRGHNRLAGKRVVVWQFAMRDLQSGNWQPIDLPTSRQTEQGQTAASSSPLLRVRLDTTPVLRPAKPAVTARFRGELARKAADVEAARSRVLHGTDGWLFYLPDVYYLSTSGFLGAERNPQIEALLDFKRQLDRRGIKLLVIPAPAKSTIYPEHLGMGDVETPQAPQNPSFAPFRQTLLSQGISFFDPTETLLRQKRQTSAPLFMPTDSHWTFVAMENTAAQLAARLHKRLPPTFPVVYTRRPASVRNITDVSMMLPHQPNNAQFVRVRQTVQQVFAPDGKLWQASPDSDILVMGDSFVNIYSHGGYWGKGAGFAAQLSYYLQRPIDLIAIDRGAMNKTRRALQLDMQGGRDRLAGKKLVIYEVASRYLMDRNWQKIELPPAKFQPRSSSTRPTPTPVADPLANRLVRATVAARSNVPEGGTTPYPDMVMTLRLTNVQLVSPSGQPQTRRAGDIVLYTWGLQNAARTPSASWKAGQSVTLRLTPWRAVESEFGSYDRTDLPGDAGTQLKAYWTTPDN
jgi:hypothetical protein